MKGCSEIREQLSAYIDGELRTEDTARLEEHLKACPKCCAALEDIRQTVAHLKGLDQVDAPPWLSQKIMAHVKAENMQPEGNRFFQKLFRPLYVKVPLGAVAALLLAFTTYFFFQNFVPPMPESRTVRQSEVPEKISPKGKMAEHVAVPEKRQDIKKSAASGEVSARKELPVVSQQRAPAPEVKQEMRSEASREAPASAPADSARMYEAKKSSSKSMLAGSAQNRGGIIREEAKPAPAQELLAKKRIEADEGTTVMFHLSASDPKGCARQVAEIVNNSDGRVIKSDFTYDKAVVAAELKAERMNEFFDMLKKIASVKEEAVGKVADTGSVIVTIEITPAEKQSPAQQN